MFNFTRRRHLRRLRRGVTGWNAWRDRKEVRPELAGADLQLADLRGANLSHADLRGADLTGADLTGANLWRAVLDDADLTAASLRNACLDDASLRRVRATRADFTGALFRETRWTDLSGAIGVEPLVGDNPEARLRERDDVQPRGELVHRVVVPRFTAASVTHPRAPSSPDGLCLFVSYTGSDAETARALIGAFEAEGHVCWDYFADPVEESDQDSLTAELIGRILGSDALVVVSSPRSGDRAWVGHEIDVADRHAKRSVDIVVAPTRQYSAKVEALGRGHFVMLDATDLEGTVRRAVGVLRDESRWGSAQILGPSE